MILKYDSYFSKKYLRPRIGKMQIQGDSLTRQNLSQVKISSFQKIADMDADSASWEQPNVKKSRPYQVLVLVSFSGRVTLIDLSLLL